MEQTTPPHLLHAVRRRAPWKETWTSAQLRTLGSKRVRNGLRRGKSWDWVAAQVNAVSVGNGTHSARACMRRGERLSPPLEYQVGLGEGPANWTLSDIEKLRAWVVWREVDGVSLPFPPPPLGTRNAFAHEIGKSPLAISTFLTRWRKKIKSAPPGVDAVCDL